MSGGRNPENIERNEAIIEMHAMGWHRCDIASTLGITVGAVQGVLSRHSHRLRIKPKLKPVSYCTEWRAGKIIARLQESA